MPRAFHQSRSIARKNAWFAAACLALATACSSDPTGTLPTDVVDPLLGLDATVTELPSGQNGDATNDGVALCEAAAITADGTCCPHGQFWDGTAGKCVPAGPAGCFATGAEDPAACVPRWCFAYLDGKD